MLINNIILVVGMQDYKTEEEKINQGTSKEFIWILTNFWRHEAKQKQVPMSTEEVPNNKEESKTETIKNNNCLKGYIADIKDETKGMSIKQINKTIIAELSEHQINPIPETLLIGGLSTLSINEVDIGTIKCNS